MRYQKRLIMKLLSRKLIMSIMLHFEMKLQQASQNNICPNGVINEHVNSTNIVMAITMLNSIEISALKEAGEGGRAWPAVRMARRGGETTLLCSILPVISPSKKVIKITVSNYYYLSKA